MVLEFPLVFQLFEFLLCVQLPAYHESAKPDCGRGGVGKLITTYHGFFYLRRTPSLIMQERIV